MYANLLDSWAKSGRNFLPLTYSSGVGWGGGGGLVLGMSSLINSLMKSRCFTALLIQDWPKLGADASLAFDACICFLLALGCRSFIDVACRCVILFAKAKHPKHRQYTLASGLVSLSNVLTVLGTGAISSVAPVLEVVKKGIIRGREEKQEDHGGRGADPGEQFRGSGR